MRYLIIGALLLTGCSWTEKTGIRPVARVATYARAAAMDPEATPAESAFLLEKATECAAFTEPEATPAE